MCGDLRDQPLKNVDFQEIPLELERFSRYILRTPYENHGIVFTVEITSPNLRNFPLTQVYIGTHRYM